MAQDVLEKKVVRKETSSDTFNKKRIHYHVHSGRLEHDGDKEVFTYKVNERPIDSEDSFEEDLLLVSFPIDYLNHISTILRHFNLKDDRDYFIEQCKDVIAVAENHQNEDGGGKMSFQSFFHNIPESICAVNDTAVVVLAIHAQKPKQGEPTDYCIAGYIHANEFEFQPYEDSDEIEKGYYYNILRVSERVVNGDKIYRRKKIFSLMFSILHSLVYQNGVNFCFACMGKENKSIKGALHRNTIKHGEYYERLPFSVFSKVSRLYGSKKYAGQLLDISHNEEMLKKMYKMVDDKYRKYLFYHYIHESIFLNFIKKLLEYSKSSGVYMLPDKNGDIAAATIAMNWGDFFMFKIQNPKGIFKLVQATRIMEKFLHFLLSVGEPEDYKKLIKGLSYKYRKEHGVGVPFLPSYPGDPYYKVSKSILEDEYAYFIICNNPEKLQRFKQRSADEEGHPRLFIDQAII